MFIPIEETPNSNNLKFILDWEILPPGQSLTVRKDAHQKSLFLQEIFSIEGVKEVFFGRNFIAVTKEEDANWNRLKLPIVAAISDNKEKNQPFFNTTPQVAQLEIEDDEIVSQIKEVLETKVRPAVAQDGGDITFHSYQDGIVYLEMHGACNGCPNATLTLKDGVENLLKYYVPEVRRVEPI
jgi:Fe-S cluster biogenesis protein NfuA